MRIAQILVVAALVGCGGDQRDAQRQRDQEVFAASEARTKRELADGYGSVRVTDTSKPEPKPWDALIKPTDAGPQDAPPPEPAVADAGPPKGGWWCATLETDLGDAGMCARDFETCDEMSDNVGAGPCAWQAKAVCFSFRNRLDDTRPELCVPSFGACELQRRVLRQQKKHDVRDVTRCKAKK